MRVPVNERTPLREPDWKAWAGGGTKTNEAILLRLSFLTLLPMAVTTAAASALRLWDFAPMHYFVVSLRLRERTHVAVELLRIFVQAPASDLRTWQRRTRLSEGSLDARDAGLHGCGLVGRRRHAERAHKFSKRVRAQRLGQA